MYISFIFNDFFYFALYELFLALLVCPHDLDSSIGPVNIYFCSCLINRVNTIDCGDEVASWLTEVIGQRCRLQQQDPDYHRASKLNRNTGKCSRVFNLTRLFFLKHEH